jgi:hypothetical protein
LTTERAQGSLTIGSFSSTRPPTVSIFQKLNKPQQNADAYFDWSIGKAKMGKSTKLGPGPTGPRTPRGKATSSRNAVKHGLYSERVSPAEEAEAARLHRAVRKDLHLHRFEDEMFGTDLVLTMIKKMRLDKYTRYESRKMDMQAFRDQRKSFELRWYTKEDSSSSPSRVHPELSALLLDEIKTNIAKRGLRPEEDLPILHRLFARGGTKRTFFGQSIIFLYEMAKSDGQSAGPRRGELQIRILKGIDHAIEGEQSMANTELLSDKDDLEVHALLPDAIADRISRSNREIQNHLLGQFDLIDRYRRLQKRRSKP